MTDDNTHQPRHPGGEDGLPVEPGTSAGDVGQQGGSDPIPAEPGFPGDDAATTVIPPVPAEDHSAWMRPAVGEERRTSEIVGALAPEEPRVEPDEEPVDVFDEGAPVTPEEAEQAQAEEHTPLDGHQHAAIVGARAALARTDVPGASLAHAPERYAEDTFSPTPGRPLGLRLLPWVAGALALALLAFGLMYAYTRKPVVVITPTPTPTVSKPPVVTADDLLSVKDAATLDPKQKWSAPTTLDKLTPTTLRPACMNSTQGQPNPTMTKQRTLTTEAASAPSMKHQIDGFATTADARNAYQARAAQLAACDEVPTWITGAAKVTGIGDEAAAVTVAYQNPTVEYHTVLLTRTGTVLHAFDVAQPAKPFSTATLAQTAKLAINRQCATSGGECAQNPSVSAILPPPSGTPGWLIASDLQRVTPGAGLWTATDTTNVTSKGTTCENLDLASVPGPSQKEQRTFLMTQDSAAPRTFGIDEIVYTFKDPRTANAFAGRLNNALTSCASRQSTAKVGESLNSTAPGEDGVKVTARTLLLQQSMGGSETARFRTAVVVAGHRVVYLVNNPSASYDLGKDKFTQIAVRSGLRMTQR
ncbi:MULTISPECIES: hypothetical protein [unclassified Luteococcus]|uniref:hypothetical protein n=1 Tax=unclassified Luteococcus TaxID=2639923 RepID=UPI00313BC10A